MIEIQYGTKDYGLRAWNEIEEGHPVALKILGWRTKLIRHLVSQFIEYDQLTRKGKLSRGIFFSLGLKSLLSRPIAGAVMGLCHHARSAGMTVAVYEKGEALEVRFGGVDTA
jgi:hypothetical protein